MKTIGQTCYISIAITFVALSTVIMRPYCRFVCPTGSILKYSQYSILNSSFASSEVKGVKTTVFLA
ncbi:4Fe-4S binding protein [Prevotella copri]|uniref:4Fe-4S binding protein n=1 Tax=Segatella copri TaxID=165179 RepID=UPI001C392A7A|nr:4Fe-4S binding protein [Segatella copri]